MKKTKYTKEILEDAVSKSINMAQVLNILGLKRSGGNHTNISKWVKFYEIDKSHFLGKASNKGKKPIFTHTKETFLEKVLIKNGLKWRSSAIKKKLFEFGIKENICELCGQKPYWNCKELTLQLDHIDGDHFNNEIINLRILCPNCHTQTKTFSGRNLNRSMQ